MQIAPNSVGKRITPSVVGFQNGEKLVGDAAVYMKNNNAENTIYDTKRMIGKHFNDPEIQADMINWPFKV